MSTWMEGLMNDEQVEGRKEKGCKGLDEKCIDG